MTQKPDQDNEVSQLKRALLALKEMRARLDSVEQARTEPLAIIGMGCRFPGGANSPAAFWKLLMEGVDAISEVPPDRWSADEIYASDFMSPGKANTRWGGFIESVDQFDPAFFGISPREAMHMDPQQRILLQVAYEALEDAGLPLDKLEGSLTGVFAGIHSHSSDYASMQMRDLNDIDTHTGAGTAHSIVANRLSYLFDWQGPSIAVDTACSSSLVAAHLAAQSLRNRECNLALVAGVNLFLTPESTITFSKLQMMAADGRCKTFDSRADGFVRGEGCGVLVLKRLSDAVADGDRILALMQGSAVNQDGRTNGLTAPNGLSQQNVIRQALSNGRVSPQQITYVEAHGTGTKLGDPIEVEALAETVGRREADSQPCVLGSVKSNIGHLEAAAGLAGLIKTILVLQNEVIPPQLHIRQLNPLISFEGTRFEIATAPKAYARTDNSPRFAGVSSFGFGGTNAHIVLREAPIAQKIESSPSPAPYLLTLSARSEESLKDLAAAYESFLNTESPLEDIVFTAATRRTHHARRLAVVGSTATDIIEKLNAFQLKDSHPDIAFGQILPSSERGLAFVFSGQGPQWPGMGRDLMQSEPVFREKINEIDGLLKNYVKWSLAEELVAPEETSKLAETEVAQPAIFAMQVALAALWKSWGIVPDAVVGHSVGEIAAAHIAGALSLEDAVCVVYHRSRLMQRVTGQGRMAAVGLSRDEAQQLLANYSGLSIAAVNSPISTVLSGNADALEEIVASLTAKKLFARMLPVNYAFHSPVMDSLMAELTDALQGISPRPAKISLYSTVRGDRAQEGDYGAAYWARNIRQAVLFGPAIKALTLSGHNTFVEVSPHPVLSESISQCLETTTNAMIVPSLRRNQPERGSMLRSLGTLFTHGYPVKWEQLYPKGHIVDLPHYPWQNARYWLPNSKYVRYARIETPSIPSTEEMKGWFYDLNWQELNEKPIITDSTKGDWLILADEHGIGAALSDQLQKLGNSCRVVPTDKSSDELDWLHLSQTPRGIIDLRALNSNSPTDDSACLNALASVQALIAYQGNSSARLWLVTQGVQRVGNETIQANAAVQSLLWGLGRTISLEHPEIWGGLIDLGAGAVSELAQVIARELTTSDGEDQVAVRGGKRYGIRLERAENPSSSSVTSLSPDGAYLITGGLGALGLQLARWLAKRGAKHLVLTSRTGLSDRTIPIIRELESAGTTVSVIKADVADEAQMTALFESFGKTIPPLCGVIHAAGVVSTHALSSMDADTLRDVLKPKVDGAWLLHRLTQDLKLDFFVLFSSSAAVLGSSGLGHYAAANQYLDTLASIRHGLGLPATSINWGWWAGAGMATTEIEEQFTQIGQQAMPVDAALKALESLLCSNSAQKMFASIDWNRFKPIYEARRKRPLIERIHVAEQQKEVEHSFAGQLLSLPVGQRYERLKAHVRDQLAHVLGFSASDKIDPQQGFFTIGMDSVMAVQLRVRLEASLGQSLPSTVAFEYPTIEGLSTFLAKEVLQINVVPPTYAVDDAYKTGKSEAQQTLSEDELLSKLDDELAAFNKLADGD